MHNKKINKAITDLINLVSNEQMLNVEYSMQAIIEQMQYELKQEQLLQDHLNNREYDL